MTFPIIYFEDFDYEIYFMIMLINAIIYINSIKNSIGIEVIRKHWKAIILRMKILWIRLNWQ